MILRRLVFAYSGDARVDVYPADFELNPAFAAAVEAYVKPYALAEELGRLDEDAARWALARAYAAAVIYGSPDEDLAGLDREGWVSWLLEDPVRFDDLRALCEDRTNFGAAP